MMVGPASSCSPTTPTRRAATLLTARISSTTTARSPILRQTIRISNAERDSPLSTVSAYGRSSLMIAGDCRCHEHKARRQSPQHVAQGRHLAVGVGQWREVEPLLDRLEDRAEVVGGVIDEAALDREADGDQRDARPRSPTVADRRRDVVPVAAVLVVGDNDQHVAIERAPLQALDQLAEMSVAIGDVGVTGMQIELADRLVEG